MAVSPSVRLQRSMARARAQRRCFSLTRSLARKRKDTTPSWWTTSMLIAPAFAETLGLDSKKLIYTNPESLEDCFETIEKVILAIRKKDKDTPIMIGYDSIGTSPTKKEMDDEFGKNSEMGGALRAKVAGQCLRRINPLLRKHKAGLIIINQVRSKVGVMFGDPRTRAGGGKALLYYCGTSLETASSKSVTKCLMSVRTH